MLDIWNIFDFLLSKDFNEAKFELSLKQLVHRSPALSTLLLIC